MRVFTETLEYFIADSLDQRIVVAGESDFLFTVPENRLSLMFCHESDIHLNGEDDELIRQFLASEPFSQMQFHSREEMQRSKPQG